MEAIVPPLEIRRLHIAVANGDAIDEFELDVEDSLTVGSCPTAGLTLAVPWRKLTLLRAVDDGIVLIPDPAMYAEVDGEAIDGPTLVEPLSGGEVHLGGLTLMFRVDGKLAVPEPDTYEAPEDLDDLDDLFSHRRQVPVFGLALAGGIGLACVAMAAVAITFSGSTPDTSITTPTLAVFDGGALQTPTRETAIRKTRSPTSRTPKQSTSLASVAPRTRAPRAARARSLRRPVEAAGRSTLDKQLATQLPQLEHCLADARSRDPDVTGSITLQWAVADGRALDASVVEDSTGDHALASCVSRRAARWTFPPGTNGTVGPFVYRLDGGSGGPISG
jgi:hypothetical protein